MLFRSFLVVTLIERSEPPSNQTIIIDSSIKEVTILNDYIRINTEREHIFSPDIHVGITAKIDKTIENEKVYEALKALYHKHPLLTSTISFDEENIAYYKLNSSKPIQPEFIESKDTSLWKNWMTNTNREPFDFQTGPLMKLFVIKSKEFTTFAALGHHMLGDGISFVYFMRDFLAALDDKLDDTEQFPQIIQNELSFPKAGRLGILPKLLAKKLNCDYKKTGKRFTYHDYQVMYRKYNLSKNPAMGLYSFSTEETRRLIASCRTHNVTVNEAIMTAFMVARKNTGSRSNFLGVSCNIRNEMIEDPKESMGNYVSGLSVSTQYDDSLDFWTNARKIGDLVNKKLKKTRGRMIALSWADALDDSLMDAINFAGFDGYENATAKKLCDIVCGVPADEGLGVSNLGKFELQFDHFSLEEMYFVPPLFSADDFIVGVFTVNNKMNFCLRYAGSAMESEAVTKLFEEAKAQLFCKSVVKKEKRIAQGNTAEIYEHSAAECSG